MTKNSSSSLSDAVARALHGPVAEWVSPQSAAAESASRYIHTAVERAGGSNIIANALATVVKPSIMPSTPALDELAESITAPVREQLNNLMPGLPSAYLEATTPLVEAMNKRYAEVLSPFAATQLQDLALRIATRIEDGEIDQQLIDDSKNYAQQDREFSLAVQDAGDGYLALSESQKQYMKLAWQIIVFLAYVAVCFYAAGVFDAQTAGEFFSKAVRTLAGIYAGDKVMKTFTPEKDLNID